MTRVNLYGFEAAQSYHLIITHTAQRLEARVQRGGIDPTTPIEASIL